ncbi:MAG: ACT domain-containing protein, partial [Thermomicrobiales bacterium]|nr:ACT domain-containing protein [Thermomicrobiales bacterium]
SALDIEFAEELGYRIKLLGVARLTPSGLEQRLHPAMVRKDAPIARVDGVFNAVGVLADPVGLVMHEGRGAGAGPTASAVVADLVDIARGIRLPTFGIPATELAPHKRAAIRAHEGGYYLRLTVFDRPGAFAAIANRMAEHGISLESIVQRRRVPHAGAPGHLEPAAPQPVILITYETTESAVRAALDEIAADGHIAAEPQLIRIETLG